MYFINALKILLWRFIHLYVSFKKKKFQYQSFLHSDVNHITEEKICLYFCEAVFTWYVYWPV